MLYFKQGSPKIKLDSKSEIENYVRTSSKNSPDSSIYEVPFNTYLDFWFLSFCIGVHRNSKDTDSKLDVLTGMKEALFNKEELVQMMAIIAIEESKDPLILKDGIKVFKIANEYAASGTTILLNNLKNSKDPLNTINEVIKDFIPKD